MSIELVVTETQIDVIETANPQVTIEVPADPITVEVLQVGAQGLQGPQGIQGPQGPAGESFSVPELDTDPTNPEPGDMWVKRNTTILQPVLSHTLLQIGLTAPGSLLAYDYVLKYRTNNGTSVGVALS